VSGLAVVAVTHDTRQEILGLLATVPEDVEVVVVDTGSADGTAAAVRSAAPRARVLELANAGFGRGANAGIRATRAAVVVVCNADVRFDPDALPALAAAVTAAPDIAAAGPRVRYPDGTRQASARRDPDLRTSIGHALFGRLVPDNRWTRRYHGSDLAWDVARDVDWLSGCALALRRAAVEAVGGFDPGYFLYVEDVDLAVRLREAGWRLRYEPTGGVVHRVGASTSRRRWRALTLHARSLHRFVLRRLAPPVALVVRPVLAVALAGWVVLTYVSERTHRLRGGHLVSSTGERVAPRVGPSRDSTEDT
jgi:N-acetylglucosaminyl-diphospho-decaprenol L-rhamnosyltransferase